MTDKVYPASKPKATAAAAAAAAAPTATATTPKTTKLPPPPMKSQLYNNNHNRHPYRPNPTYPQRHRHRHRHRPRRYFCICCFWSILIITLLLLLATISGCILYLLYHPRRPTFSITSLKLSQFNLTTAADDTTHLTSKLNLTISTKNPNKKIIFSYDPISISCLFEDTQIANGSFRNSFTSNPSNITIIRSSLNTNSLLLETEKVNQIRSDLKKRSGLPLKLLLDTQATMKIESIKSKKVGIRIKCVGIHTLIPKASAGKSNSSSSSSPHVAAAVSDAKCEVDLRIKIWKWTF